MSELDTISTVLGQDAAFKVRMGMLLSGETSAVRYVCDAVHSHVDVQMDEAESGDTVVVDAREWDQVRERANTATETLAKYEQLQAKASQNAEITAAPEAPPVAERKIPERRDSDAVKRNDAALRDAIESATPATVPAPAPEKPVNENMIEKVREQIATVRYTNQRAAAARKRHAEEGKEKAESWETAKPSGKRPRSSAPAGEQKTSDSRQGGDGKQAPAGNAERPERKVAYTRQSPKVEIARAILTVIEPDVKAGRGDTSYTAGLLAEGIEFGAESTRAQAVAKSLANCLVHDLGVPVVRVQIGKQDKYRQEFRVDDLHQVLTQVVENAAD